jgi:hypothetical protein
VRVRSPHLAVCAALVAFVLLASGQLGTDARAATSRDNVCTLDRATGTTIDAIPEIAHGYAAHYNAPTDRVAFMQPDLLGYYRAMTMNADGSDVRAVDAGSSTIPRKHQGSPAWHPSGRWLIFTVQKQAWSGRKLFGVPDYEAIPGFGRHDDLWIASPDGRDARTLTDEPDTADEGVLIPVFSRDGTRVAWSARLPGGTYELRVAEFVPTPVPHLENVRAYRPGGSAYYETGSFTSDGSGLTYTSDQDTHSFWHSQIYVLDLATGRDTRLTAGNDYDEHPVVIPTPSGDWVVYMSTKGVDRTPGHLLLGTDWYAMRIDGTGTKRLTTMNLNAPNNPENTGAMEVAGRVSPGPTPDILFGDVQNSLVRQTGSTKRVHLVCN